MLGTDSASNRFQPESSSAARYGAPFLAETQVLEMVASGDSLLTTLSALCRGFQPEFGFASRCAVCLIDSRDMKFQEVVAPSLPTGFTDAIRGQPVVCESGPCGRAAHLKSQMITADVEFDPQWQFSGFCALAMTYGQRSWWSTPILSRTREVLGTFAVLQAEPIFPLPSQQRLISKAVHIAGLAIERAQRDAVLALTQRFLAQSQHALDEARNDLAYAARVMSLGALSASIAHEIKQPLSGIVVNASACLRMLAADPPDLAGARETAKRTLRDGNRASEVVTRLQVLFTKKTITGEMVDLNQLAQEAVTLALNDLQCRRISVQTELTEELPPVWGDRIQLHQVILNLILNAADSMSNVEGRPRRLNIRTQRDGDDRVLVSVEDTGAGFAERGTRLFEPFYTTKSDGMGIGLSVSHAIVDSHGGRLWADANEGPGATFRFYIPCAQPSAGSR
jgi:signal transduction histidine kinase